MKFDAVWRAYGQSLKAFLHSKVANPEEVDDLLQEILIKSHQNLEQLTDGEKLKPWLFQIANRTVIDFYRKKAVRDNLFSEVDNPVKLEQFSNDGVHSGELTSLPKSWREQDSVTMSQELVACLSPFLANLPQKSQKLLQAIDIDGQSQKEYATEQGVSYSTLKSQVQRARIALRAQFEQCCHFDIDSRGKIVEYQSKNNRCDKC